MRNALQSHNTLQITLRNGPWSALLYAERTPEP